MKIVSFNCRGLARTDKKLALRRLLSTSPIDVIFLQGTLSFVEAISLLSQLMLPDWSFIGLDASGHSGGIALGFNLHTINLCNCWGVEGGRTLPKFVWSHISGRRTPPTTTGHIVEGFAQNLNELKRLSKIWAQNKRRQDDQTLREAEIEIVDFESNLGGLYSSNEHKDRISSQYADRGEILKDSEESWRLRSRAIWMLEEDDNTKFYHKFANGRKAINTIWQLPNEQGHPLNTFP
eukprot:PITA_13627